jgi:hypothetical protein
MRKPHQSFDLVYSDYDFLLIFSLPNYFVLFSFKIGYVQGLKIPFFILLSVVKLIKIILLRKLF